jgi:hypothetical protein
MVDTRQSPSRRIVDRTVADAEAGDGKAPGWLSEFLLNGGVQSLTELAATELAGTLDQEITIAADGLRASAVLRGHVNRLSKYPALDLGQPDGHRENDV